MMVRHDAKKGRYVVATENVIPGTCLLTELPYVCVPFDDIHIEDNDVYDGNGGDNVYERVGLSSKKGKYQYSLMEQQMMEIGRSRRQSKTSNPTQQTQSLPFDGSMIMLTSRVIMQYIESPTQCLADINKLYGEFHMLISTEKEYMEGLFATLQIIERLVFNTVASSLELQSKIAVNRIAWPVPSSLIGSIFAKLKLNSFEITNELTSLSIGVGLYLEAACFNHSCSPNACQSFDVLTGAIRIMAIDHIRTETEICISYTSIHRPRYWRQMILKDSFKFDCRCLRCLEDYRQENLPLCKRLCSRSNVGVGGGWLCRNCTANPKFPESSNEHVTLTIVYQDDIKVSVSNASHLFAEYDEDEEDIAPKQLQRLLYALWLDGHIGEVFDSTSASTGIYKSGIYAFKSVPFPHGLELSAALTTRNSGRKSYAICLRCCHGLPVRDLAVKAKQWSSLIQSIPVNSSSGAGQDNQYELSRRVESLVKLDNVINDMSHWLAPHDVAIVELLERYCNLVLQSKDNFQFLSEDIIRGYVNRVSNLLKAYFTVANESFPLPNWHPSVISLKYRFAKVQMFITGRKFLCEESVISRKAMSDRFKRAVSGSEESEDRTIIVELLCGAYQAATISLGDDNVLTIAAKALLKTSRSDIS